MIVRINESQIGALEEREVTFEEFFVNAKQFIRDLLNKGESSTNEPDFFSKHNIDKGELLGKMKDLNLIVTKEKIVEKPDNENGGKLRAVHVVQYKVPKKRFEDKMHELHKELFG